MIEKQKALNQAFYATLVMSGLSLGAFIFLGYVFTVNPIIALVELILFPILGFLVMKGKQKAGLALIIIFLIDRLFIIDNIVDLIQQSGITAVFLPVFLSFVYWIIFYKAYLYLKRDKTATE